MRPVFWSFLAGVNAIVAISIIDYLLTPTGDTHLGSSIYVLLAFAYFVCLLLGTAVAKLCTILLQEVRPTHLPGLCLSFLGILFSNTGAFLLIYRAVLGYWAWELTVWSFVAPLVVGFVAASAFVYGYRVRSS